MSKKIKGEWGYINYQRKRVMLITLVLYVCAIGIYLFGYLSLNTTKNLFSVIAVLGILPASKSLVNLIMFMRFKSLSEEIHGSYYEASGDGLCIVFETPFTTYEKTYFIEAIACRNKTVACFYPGKASGKGKCADKTQDIKKLTEHLLGVLKNDGYKDVTVKVFDDREDFIKRIRELSGMKESDRRADEAILNTLLSVSL